ncbi:Golgi SNAP receptor complex member [Trichinella pseudospiralis]
MSPTEIDLDRCDTKRELVSLESPSCLAPFTITESFIYHTTSPCIDVVSLRAELLHGAARHWRLLRDSLHCAPLTPAHFFIGRELTSLFGMRWRWEHQLQLMSHLWKRWVEEYLVMLTTRGKCTKIRLQPENGYLVYVEVTCGRWRNRWKLGCGKIAWE